MAKCMIAMENYQDAMQVYTTLEKSYPEELKLWRAIGWNAFLTGNLFQAEYYLEKVLAVAPDAIDLLNAGHIALCLNKRTEAVEFYRKTLAMQDHSLEFIVRQMEADKSHLLKNGISADDIQLIVDALAYSFT